VGLCCLVGMDLDLRRIKSNDSKSLPRPGRFSVLQPRPCLVSKNFQDFPSYRIFGHMYGALDVDEKKLIIQFSRKLRNESFEPN
jgi:hypothetical protein